MGIASRDSTVFNRGTHKYIIAMMGGYLCLGLIFALLVRKTGTVCPSLLAMMFLDFINLLAL